MLPVLLWRFLEHKGSTGPSLLQIDMCPLDMEYIYLHWRMSQLDIPLKKDGEHMKLRHTTSNHGLNYKSSKKGHPGQLYNALEKNSDKYMKTGTTGTDHLLPIHYPEQAYV